MVVGSLCIGERRRSALRVTMDRVLFHQRRRPVPLRRVCFTFFQLLLLVLVVVQAGPIPASPSGTSAADSPPFEATTAAAVSVTTAINGAEETLFVEADREPYFASAAFCRHHDIHVNPEGMDSTTLLAEELIARRGGRFEPWLSPAPLVLALLPHSRPCVRRQLAAFCRRHRFPVAHCAALWRNVSAALPSWGYGEGEKGLGDAHGGDSFFRRDDHHHDDGGGGDDDDDETRLLCTGPYEAHYRTERRLARHHPVYLPLRTDPIGDVQVPLETVAHFQRSGGATTPKARVTVAGLTTAVDPVWAGERICVQYHDVPGECNRTAITAAIAQALEAKKRQVVVPSQAKDQSSSSSGGGGGGGGDDDDDDKREEDEHDAAIPYLEEPELILQVGLQFIESDDIGYREDGGGGDDDDDDGGLRVDVGAHSRQLVVFPGEAALSVAASFCARQRCPNRVQAVAALTEMIEAARRGEQPHAYRGILEQPPPPPSLPRDGAQERTRKEDEGEDEEDTAVAAAPPGMQYLRRHRWRRCDALRSPHHYHHHQERVVVSLSTLPSRLPHLAGQLQYLLNQTLQPDLVYVNAPLRSLRERSGYDQDLLDRLESPGRQVLLPLLDEGTDHDEEGGGEVAAGRAVQRVRVLRGGTDWGPATKLIPALLAESGWPAAGSMEAEDAGSPPPRARRNVRRAEELRSPRAPPAGPTCVLEHPAATTIVTVDDDVNYPPTLLEDLVRAGRRHRDVGALWNGALGLSGYRVRGRPFRHPNFDYLDTTTVGGVENEEEEEGEEEEDSSTTADVLGGMSGVLYRPAFFDPRRLVDYGRFPGAAFFVDDDWISAALDEGGIPRVVLGAESARRSAAVIFETAVLNSEITNLASLNGEQHSFRNIMFQEVAMDAFVEAGMFDRSDQNRSSPS